MKHLLILFLFAFSFIGALSAQKTISQDSLHIIFNARTGNLNTYPPYEVNQDGYIIFEIQDINLFRYSISVTELQDNIINSTNLSEGKTLINVDPSFYNLSNINLQIPNETKANNKEENAVQMLTIEKSIEDKELEIERHIIDSQINDAKYFDAKNRDTKRNDLAIEISELQKKIDATSNKKEKELLENLLIQKQTQETDLNLKYDKDRDDAYISTYEDSTRVNQEKTLRGLKDSLRDLRFTFDSIRQIDDSKNSKIVDFDIKRKNYIRSMNSMNRLVDIYYRLINILYSDKGYDEISKEKDLVTTDLFGTTESVTKDHLLKLCLRKFRSVEANFQRLSESYKDISDDPDIEKVFNIISAFHNQINYDNYNRFFLQLTSIYESINKSNFTLKYQTFILSDNADLITFNLTATPFNNLPGSIETRPVNFEYIVKVKGGVKIDVSTGVFFNIGLNDKSFRFEAVDDNTSRVIKEENKNLFKPFYGVLFNVYERSYKDVKFGFNAGVSTNTERVNYYLGSSIIFGRSQRIILNFGLAGAQIDEATDMFDTNETFSTPLSDLPSKVPLRNPSPFRLGGFFGISFNLTGTVNKQTLSQISKLKK